MLVLTTKHCWSAETDLNFKLRVLKDVNALFAGDLQTIMVGFLMVKECVQEFSLSERWREHDSIEMYQFVYDFQGFREGELGSRGAGLPLSVHVEVCAAFESDALMPLFSATYDALLKVLQSLSSAGF